MIYLSLTFFSLAAILILIKPIEARILLSDKLTVELESFPIKVVLSDFDNKTKQKNKGKQISTVQIVKLIHKALSLSSVRIKNATLTSTSTSLTKSYYRLGTAFALLYPTLAFLMTSARDVRIDEGAINLDHKSIQDEPTKYSLDLTLSSSLFCAVRLLLSYLYEHHKYKRRRRWKTI